MFSTTLQIVLITLKCVGYINYPWFIVLLPVITVVLDGIYDGIKKAFFGE